MTPQSAYEAYQGLKASILSNRSLKESDIDSALHLAMERQIKQLRAEKDTINNKFAEAMRQKDLEVSKLRNEILILRKRLDAVQS